MRFKGVLASLFILAICGSPNTALAFNQRITVYASVPEVRLIYVNDAGFITKIVGNTARNITPKVVDENNQTLSMTDAINQQYQQFLKGHSGHIEASKYYYLNLVSVNTAPNTQSIKIDSSNLTLSL